MPEGQANNKRKTKVRLTKNIPKGDKQVQVSRPRKQDLMNN